MHDLRKDFPFLRNNPHLIYFDSAATTLKPQCVIDTVLNYYAYQTSNVHRGDCQMSFEVSQQYDQVREKVAKLIDCEPEQVVYTSGTTHGLNQCAAYLKQICKEGDVILTTLLEHASNILPIFDASHYTGFKIEYVLTTPTGEMVLDDLKQKLKQNVKAICISHVSNVLGTVQPLKEIIELAHQNNTLVIIDAAQSIPHMPISVRELDVDMLCFSGHKMCGASGVGILYAKHSILKNMQPIFYGGGSNARFEMNQSVLLKDYPEKFESGTPNIEGVLALGSSIDYLLNIGLAQIEAYEKHLKAYFIEKLKDLSHVVLYNEKTPSAIVAFNVKNVFAQDCASYLSHHGICVRSGNHCAKLLKEVIGINETVRASLYFYNTTEEIDQFIEVLKQVNEKSVIDIFF